MHQQIVIHWQPRFILELDVLPKMANAENIICEDQRKYQCVNVSLHSESQNWRLCRPEDKQWWGNVSRTNVGSFADVKEDHTAVCMLHSNSCTGWCGPNKQSSGVKAPLVRTRARLNGPFGGLKKLKLVHFPPWKVPLGEQNDRYQCRTC